MQELLVSLRHEHRKRLFKIRCSDIPPSGPWPAFVFTDGQIVTGANPTSTHVTAEEAVKLFDKLYAGRMER